ncbi:MAG TPA: metal-dependent hydrolase [Acidimicrobiales bacterium]|nr:metal-dependent hydrolase [Acidimicrobiales bacterium]
MSWAAHELESYFLQKHVKVTISFLAILLGCLSPDLFTKLPAYGIHIGSRTLLKAADAATWQRGWPGAGFTHSLTFGVVIAIIVLGVTRSRAWFLGLLVGQFAHALTDTFDSVGTMLFFPFTTQHYGLGMWAYGAQAGRYADAAAYYSSLGGVWDVVWIVIAISGIAVFKRAYFFDTVVPNDPVWPWVQTRLHAPDRVLVAAYRAFFIYGACRVAAWFGWARLLNPLRGTDVFDPSWDGPRWVARVTAHAATTAIFWANTGRGLALWLISMAAVGWFVVRPLWNRAAPTPPPPSEPALASR